MFLKTTIETARFQARTFYASSLKGLLRHASEIQAPL